MKLNSCCKCSGAAEIIKSEIRPGEWRLFARCRNCGKETDAVPFTGHEAVDFVFGSAWPKAIDKATEFWNAQNRR